MPETKSEAQRLQNLWGGEFGDAYNERNKNAYDKRAGFWKKLLPELSVKSVLEIGCNVGGNLRWMHPPMEWHDIYGIDINLDALRRLHEEFPAINAIKAAAQNLPFRDGFFDLTFTTGVLIHQPEESLAAVMSEIVRCSKRYVLCMEYFADKTEEVPYRGHEGALFRRDYGALYRKNHSELSLVKEGYLSAEEGFDRLTWWLFEKR
ncbi:MAG: methyltransferase domain-containing protein [Candidatus Peribacteraceae bacterium]|nr:methyltransferase domain-containing protein [Candidatus Peribacteraceae bacterium]